MINLHNFDSTKICMKAKMLRMDDFHNKKIKWISLLPDLCEPVANYITLLQYTLWYLNLSCLSMFFLNCPVKKVGKHLNFAKTGFIPLLTSKWQAVDINSAPHSYLEMLLRALFFFMRYSVAKIRIHEEWKIALSSN